MKKINISKFVERVISFCVIGYYIIIAAVIIKTIFAGEASTVFIIIAIGLLTVPLMLQRFEDRYFLKKKARLINGEVKDTIEMWKKLLHSQHTVKVDMLSLRKVADEHGYTRYHF